MLTVSEVVHFRGAHTPYFDLVRKRSEEQGELRVKSQVYELVGKTGVHL
jgi:hypothetical protein